MFAAAFDFGSYANFRAFAQKQGRAGHFCQSETDWDLSLSLSGIWFAARFALTVQCVLLLLIETLMKTLAKKATWNRLQPALPLMRKRCKIHKGFYFTPRRSRRALPCIFSFFWFHNSTSVSLRPFPLRDLWDHHGAAEIPRPDPARVQTPYLGGGGGTQKKKNQTHTKKKAPKRAEPPDFRQSHINPLPAVA